MKLPPTKLKPWSVLSSNDISPSKWLPLLEERVEVGNGKQLDFFLLNMGPAVMVFPFTKDKKLVLVRQYKHGIQEIVIEGVAGMVDEGETHTQTAVRELIEEAGITVNEQDLISIGTHAQSTTKSRHTLEGFVVFDVDFNTNPTFDSHADEDEHEDIEVLTIDPKEAIDMIISGEIWVSDVVAYILKLKILYPELFN